ncbi:MAG: hydrolase [Gammaproteobacteria bacterium]|nr:hydrolase [Gammaproteobacteria bacterium]
MTKNSSFNAPWWLRSPHLQTIWPLYFRRRKKLPVQSERLELPDGDYLDLAWVGKNQGPLVLLMHGLEGSIESHYATGLLNCLHRQGVLPVLMHFRGCSGKMNRLPRSYHSGDTGDLEQVIRHVQEKAGKTISAIVGYSLGGNVLLKWLGTGKIPGTLQTAVAVSVPFSLDDCARKLDCGVSRLYRNHLLRRLRASYKRKRGTIPMPIDVDVDSIKGFREFDDKVTAPLHGFLDVDHYYRESSCRQYLRHIETPVLILHARDDPFMWSQTIPQESELSSAVNLEVSEQGGHVGFVAGPHPFKADYWLERRISAHLGEYGIGDS